VITVDVICGVVFAALAIALVWALTRRPRPRGDRPAMQRSMHNARQAARMDAAIRRAIR
jgi:membrane-associated phospholipid phosphatase